MEIRKSTSTHPRQCAYGDFELIPEPGWKISRTFIDYESKLLVVSTSLLDESKWIDSGFQSRIIPTKQYIIDLHTLSILQPEEWKKYFRYDTIETTSEDKQYTLISRRIFEPEQNSDSYTETLYDTLSNTVISRSHSIAFRADKRETLLESHYRTIQERKEKEEILATKPTLKEFSVRELEKVANHDVILFYSDYPRMYQLTFADTHYELSKSDVMRADDTPWKLNPFEPVSRYAHLDEFWKDFTTDTGWYTRFSPLRTLDGKASHPMVLAAHIISFFNALRRNHHFTYEEHDAINLWSSLVWSDVYKETEIKQWCPLCHQEVFYQPRYPKYICGTCASKDIYDRQGHLLEFSNLGFSGGFRITYRDKDGNTIREDDQQEICECIIENKHFFAQEARFGGIVIQAKT